MAKLVIIMAIAAMIYTGAIALVWRYNNPKMPGG
jgi:hypothetical protein